MGLPLRDLREYTFDDFICHINGYQKAQAHEWDRTRHVMFAVLKAAGAKSIKKIEDVMRLPLIDKTGDPEVYKRLAARLKKFKEDAAT